MKGYYECIKCHHQWKAITFDTIPCPKCSAHGVARAVVGGPKPAWYTGSETPIEESRS